MTLEVPCWASPYVLAAVGEQSLTVARVLEAHSDALAILSKARAPAPEGTWGVRRVADLELYVRQHHAERDLARLDGTVLAARPDGSAA